MEKKRQHQAALKKLTSKTAVKNKALAYLARREYSRFELWQKLTLRADKALIEEVLDELETSGYCDDMRFSQSYLRFRSQQGFGPLKMQAELKLRGISRDIIEQVIQEMDWDTILYQAWCKRVTKEDYADTRLLEKKMRFFAGRGFTHDSIRMMLQKQIQQEE